MRKGLIAAALLALVLALLWGGSVSLPDLAPSRQVFKESERSTEGVFPPDGVASTARFREQAVVTKIVDGDTIDVELDGRIVRVRYLGIDTPESVHPARPVECYAKEASEKNRALVLGETVTLERDITDSDKYGRLLRYVFVGDALVNYELVSGGFAHVVTYPPDVKYQEVLLGAQREARSAFRGLWGGCEDGVNSSEEREENAASCFVKGNITSAGERIYHSPGCGSYEKTVIHETTGERWFCSEGEAEAAGWRKALNCP